MKIPQHLTVLGENARHLRDESGLTQEELAERSGLDPSYISGIERGVRNPSISSLLKLARGLGVTVAKLCTGIER